MVVSLAIHAVTLLNPAQVLAGGVVQEVWRVLKHTLVYHVGVVVQRVEGVVEEEGGVVKVIGRRRGVGEGVPGKVGVTRWVCHRKSHSYVSLIFIIIWASSLGYSLKIVRQMKCT